MEIDSKAKRCPHCQADQRSWPARHPILTGLGVLILIGIIMSAIGGSNNSSTQTQTTGTTGSTNTQVENSPSSQPSEKPQDATPKVGDVAKLGDREFIVNTVKRSKALGYSTPKAGKEFVAVNVTIRNLGTDEVSYNPYDFKVQDANGAQESTTFASLDDSLSSGTLASNGKVTGSMAFEVPIGDQATLIFQPSFWSNQRVVVDLGNK